MTTVPFPPRLRGDAISTPLPAARPVERIAWKPSICRASGAPRNYARALFAYNPSSLYVRAVLGYARVMARRPSALYELYAWQVYVRDRRMTGPGRG